MFPCKSCQEWLDKSPKLVGQTPRYNWWDKCPTSYTVKICPASSSVAVFKRKLRPLCFS